MAIAERNGVSAKAISNRRYMGWSMEDAINTPKGESPGGEQRYKKMWETRRKGKNDVNK